MTKRRIVFFISVILLILGAVCLWQRAIFFDGKLHVVFCDVGQGDGIFIRTPQASNIIVDGGPDDKILSCIAKHTPFWERTIHVAVVSHPHADHFQGFIPLLDSYTIKAFATEKLTNNTVGYKQLLTLLETKRVPIQYVFAGDSIKTKDGVVLKVLGPTQAYLDKTSSSGVIGESKEFASLIVYVTYGDSSILLTGDSQVSGLLEAFEQVTPHVAVFQLPHHGSKTGVSEELFNKIHPSIGIISVGKNNYGHPSKETLQILNKFTIPYLRTDQKGDIELVLDGSTIGVKH